MPNLTIDNRPVTVDPGATILDASRKLGIEIPTLCFLEGHPATTSCMVCVVKVNGQSRLLPACATKVEEGMVVECDTDEVHAARRMALELLLGDHVGDCVGPCVTGCPAHMDIPAMIGHIAAGRFREAIAVVKEHIALPAVLGRICPAPCEKVCRRSSVDSPVSICLLKRFAADIDLASDDPYMPPCKPATGKRVAIIGAGPAGLAAAYYLLQEGIACTIYDDHTAPGGMLRYGVPMARLPHDVLDAEIGLIERLGAKFELGVAVNAADLRQHYDAVLLAVGKIDQERAAMPGVFAVGSAVKHSQLAVRAVAEGRTAARAILHYLFHTPIRVHDKPFTVRIGRLVEGEIDILADGASREKRVEPARDGFSPDEAELEARRCLHCECGKLSGCKLRDYAIEYHAYPTKYRGERERVSRESSHPAVIYEPGKCISCGICIEIAAEAKEPLGFTFIGRGFTVTTSVPFDEPLSEGLRKVAEQCAKACPTAALCLRNKHE